MNTTTTTTTEEPDDAETATLRCIQAVSKVYATSTVSTVSNFATQTSRSIVALTFAVCFRLALCPEERSFGAQPLALLSVWIAWQAADRGCAGDSERQGRGAEVTCQALL